jgi:AcrR family transcriptional regulator
MEMDYRQKIIEQASELFRMYGIRAVTMDMLAGSMGISKRTIYEVFHDKNELLQGVLKWMGCRQKDMIAKVMNDSDNVIEATFKMLDNMKKHFQNMSPAFQLDMRKFHVDLIRKMGDSKELPYYRDNVNT